MMAITINEELKDKGQYNIQRSCVEELNDLKEDTEIKNEDINSLLLIALLKEVSEIRELVNAIE